MSSEYSGIFGEKSNGGSKSAGYTTKTIHLGTVKSFERIGNIVTIKVRVNGLDNHLADEKLPVCFPFQPINIVMTPKVGEVVRVLLSDVSSPFEDRLWVGPVLTDYLNVDGQVYPAGNRMTLDEQGLSDLFKQPHAANLTEIQDAIPNHTTKQDDAVWFLGRGNVDFFFKGNSATLRAGKQDAKDKKKKNKVNPATMTVQYSKDGKTSSGYMIADTMAFISHNGNPLVNESRNGTLSDEQLESVMESLHPMGRGDIIVEVLTLLIQAVCDHSHPYNGQPAIKSALVKKLQSYDLNSILNKNIKIN
jgi:lambda repressor-like predicted transcriptional regulator